MKAGDIVKIYEDLQTEKRLEGEAKLIEKLQEDSDREYWLVEFTSGPSKALGKTRSVRWIKKHHSSNPGPQGNLLCQRIQYFIDDEEKATAEYEELMRQLREGPFPDLSVMVWRIAQEEREHRDQLIKVKEALSKE